MFIKSCQPRNGESCFHSTGHVGWLSTKEWEWRGKSTSRWTSRRPLAAMTPSASYGVRSRVFESVYVSSAAACTV